MSESDALNLISERMHEAFAVERLVLFGSRAKGAAAPDSDYDVLVVAKSDVPFTERQGVALKALGKRPFPIDLLVFTPDELDAEAKVLGSIVYWALREGRDVTAIPH